MPTRMREPIEPDDPPERVDLVQGMPVAARDGRPLGRLEEARCPGADHVAQWLVVSRGRSDRRLIANARVVGGRGTALLTDLEPAAWRSLVPACPDDVLRERVEAALQEPGDPAESFLRTLRIRVAAQHVFLQGYAAGPERIEEAVRRVRGVQGVLDVSPRIITNAELQAVVAKALVADPRTRAEAIRVKAAFGRVDLLGQASASAAVAADRIAAAVPGVLAVHRYLALPPAAPRADAGRARVAAER